MSQLGRSRDVWDLSKAPGSSTSSGGAVRSVVLVLVRRPISALRGCSMKSCYPLGSGESTVRRGSLLCVSNTLLSSWLPCAFVRCFPFGGVGKPKVSRGAGKGSSQEAGLHKRDVEMVSRENENDGRGKKTMA